MSTLVAILLGLFIGGATAGIIALIAATAQLREHNDQLTRLLAVTQAYRDRCQELAMALEREAELRRLQAAAARR